MIKNESLILQIQHNFEIDNVIFCEKEIMNLINILLYIYIYIKYISKLIIKNN